jgi:putative addiction module killer protein
MITIDIQIYITTAGQSPFLKWLSGLDVHERAIVRTRIDRVRLGNFGDAKQIKDGQGIWELRIDHGPGYRLYYRKLGNSVILLLLGGSKGSQQRNITTAKKYWLEYKEKGT